MPPALKTSPTETDCLVIGAGPAALFLIFELGLLEIECHVVDVLPHAGGQCMALYADKPIYDIPSRPRTTGRELVNDLLAQAAPFKAPFHLGQQVSALELQADARWLAPPPAGKRFYAKPWSLRPALGHSLPENWRTSTWLP
jgi:thioredoxin reductase (NADPH)